MDQRSSHCHSESVRIRVHELAKELGLTSSELLGDLRDRGVFWIRSASSLLDPQLAADLRRAAGVPPDQAVPRPSMPRPTSAPWRDDEDCDDPREQLTAAQGARELRVMPAAVRQWVHRGYLSPVGTRGRAHLFRRVDLETARDRARANTRRPPVPFPIRPSMTRRPVTTLEAARIAGVTPSAIRTWVLRGHLHPLPQAGRGHRFDPMQVLRVARRR
ncbi:translation initiation factor IF-2 N-terminal domain-containing protein [Isoptericola croceus]|uniref:translation initiation factor IF-2 N-terminal domain-containing protein n=1 Tax=Isoptericola croceus TaxID=3031406 RepID=UPI0027DFFDC0|nr:translation initiation factor IF-2 N-terminal domain-containing protein [Isoptericola croceus]